MIQTVHRLFVPSGVGTRRIDACGQRLRVRVSIWVSSLRVRVRVSRVSSLRFGRCVVFWNAARPRESCASSREMVPKPRETRLETLVSKLDLGIFHESDTTGCGQHRFLGATRRRDALVSVHWQYLERRPREEVSRPRCVWSRLGLLPTAARPARVCELSLSRDRPHVSRDSWLTHARIEIQIRNST